ncbi:SH3 domain-containing protein [Pseudonocardia humida]|uniref:SH3b domain-containing protein n=1 Tax=Pseudonocardia humida TaxID=2800819 RepID=A0ABT1A4A4_9PSEU|nr:SH3 domain-containing protein [Pseudonocardia humida]MCO1657835.1 hypothetical protein [Pseudonocardia humida]
MTGTRGRPGSDAVIRAGRLLAAAALLVLPVGGCAVAGRLLTAAGTAASVVEMVEPGAEAGAATSAAAERRTAHAVVSGTGRSGLRLNRVPGAERLAVLPDGTRVEVRCRAVGRVVGGPYGPTAAWSSVRTPDGRTGYMSEAFLRFEIDPDGVSPC